MSSFILFYYYTCDVKQNPYEHKAMVKAGLYEAYSVDKVAMASSVDVVIFFHASWCPSGRGHDTNIVSLISGIKDWVTILKADYDKETEMKKKYGVTTQHTLAQVDKDGNLIKNGVVVQS